MRVRVGDEVVIVARPLVERVLGEDAEVLAHFPGTALEGIRYEAPFDYIKGEDFGPRGHTVLLADFVSTEDGTGLVHTALAFGEDDFRLGEQYGMTLQNPVRAGRHLRRARARLPGQDGLRAQPRDRRGAARAGPAVSRRGVRARLPALLALRHAAALLREVELVHPPPPSVRDLMLEVNEGIDWHPEHIKHGRFGKWLEGNVDWALSRERYWGTPLPIWECDRTARSASAPARSPSCASAAATVPDDLHRPYIDDVVLECESCGGEMRRVVETIDAWFDSGSMPFAQFHHPFENTRGVRVSGFPPTTSARAWTRPAAGSTRCSPWPTLVFGRGSYEHCVCLGLIADPEGQKMSKSRGNVVDPWEVLDRHGADAFRWYYLSSQQPWAGYRFSAETVGEAVRQFMLTLWNTYSFFVLYANAEGLGPDDLGGRRPLGDGADLDRWALSRLQGLTRR